MLSKLLDFVVGREPVATATGIAAVVTAGLGVGAAFGLDITAEQIAAIGALTAALAGWLGRSAVTPVDTPADREVRRMIKNDRGADDAAAELDRGPVGDEGGIPLALIILIVVGILIIGGLFASCDALINDEDEKNDLGLAPALVLNHEGDECWDYGDCGGGYDERNGGSGDGRGGDGRYGGGRSGDYDGGPGDDCRNACGNTIIVPTPGDRGREQR